MWATSGRLPNEPLDGQSPSSIPHALLYFGKIWSRIAWNPALSPNTYQDNLKQILSTLTEHGIIPILTTFPTGYTFHNDGSADVLNAMLVQIAAGQHLPLIDLRASILRIPPGRRCR